MPKSKNSILQQLSGDFLAEQDKVTYMGKSGVVRALFSATAALLYELWNDIYQVKRRIQVSTAEGSDLDLLAERHGLTRRAETKSSCILLFNGPSDTVIPTGTIVKSNLNEVRYQTLIEITLGQNNPAIQRPIYSNALGDIVLTESLITGSNSKVGIKELTIIDPSIEDVEVTNLVPSIGGEDEETDAELRSRILGQLDLLNQGTTDFYKALSRAANGTVLRSLPIYNPLNGGIDIYLVKNSLG